MKNANVVYRCFHGFFVAQLLMKLVHHIFLLILSYFLVAEGLKLTDSLKKFIMAPASTRFTLMQFVNLPGLKALGFIYTNPTYVLPDIHLPSVAKLDLDDLKARGIKCLVFDKDNTLRYYFTVYYLYFSDQ